MDTGLLNDKGLVELELGEVLRLRDAAGRHISVVRGFAWVTQDGDLQDHALGAGESFRFDRNGLALVMPLGVETTLVLEDGLNPQGKETPDRPAAGIEDFALFERRARRLRAEAMGQAFADAGHALKGLWDRIARIPAAALQAKQTARDLRGLSDHVLKDLGLRRDQIDCVARRLPC